MYNIKKKKDKRTNYDPQNTTLKECEHWCVYVYVCVVNLTNIYLDHYVL
jgi:hypothetical protein